MGSRAGEGRARAEAAVGASTDRAKTLHGVGAAGEPVRVSPVSGLGWGRSGGAAGSAGGGQAELLQYLLCGFRLQPLGRPVLVLLFVGASALFPAYRALSWEASHTLLWHVMEVPSVVQPPEPLTYLVFFLGTLQLDRSSSDRDKPPVPQPPPLQCSRTARELQRQRKEIANRHWEGDPEQG